MNTTLLACTACLEIGLAAGYGLCAVREWIAQGRAMVMALSGGAP